MRIEIRTATEITSVSFPSITDASYESAVFFIENGWTESAKRVIENMAREGKEMAEYALSVIHDLNDVVDSETENVNYWRTLCESRTEQLDIMRMANEKLVKENDNRKAEVKTWMHIADDKSNTIRIINAENRGLRESYNALAFDFLRLEKAFAGISRGYGKLKRAFNAHTKKINQLNSEIANLANENIQEQMFADKMMAQNAELIERLSMYQSL